jgi:hypothetical protein
MNAPAQQGRLVRRGAVVEAEVGGEVVALNAETAECYGLNGAGSRIWRLLALPVTAAEIVGALLAEYEVGEAECERAVRDLLAQLLAEGLIEPARED